MKHSVMTTCSALQDPVCTPDGYMFSREAILENLLQQKKANKRRYAAWEAQQQDEQRKVRTFRINTCALAQHTMRCLSNICLDRLQLT